MILIVGASGSLGSAVARRLLADGQAVRAMSRTPGHLDALAQSGAEVIAGDLRDASALARACAGVDMVLSAAHGFNGARENASSLVDGTGGQQLIVAAREAGVRQFVLTSIHGARKDHPVDTFRYKFANEQALRASGLSYTILRPTAYMQLWLTIMSEPMLKRGQALIFGRGINPINFVSVIDVARFAHIALTDPQARGLTIEIGGPENLTLVQFVETIERVTGRIVPKRHIPRPMMQAMAPLTWPFNPFLSRQMTSAVEMDTANMTFDPSPTLARFPGALARLADVARERFATPPGA